MPHKTRCVNAHDRCYGGAGGPCPYCEQILVGVDVSEGGDAETYVEGRLDSTGVLHIERIMTVSNNTD